MRNGWIGFVGGAVLTGMLVGGGCGARLDPTLPPEAFVNRRPAIGPDSGGPISRSGQLAYDTQRQPVREATGGAPIPPIAGEDAHLLSAATQPAVLATQPAVAESQSQPETIPSTLPLAQYQSVGGVIEVVNGQPIYTDRVLSILSPSLAIDARSLTLENFRLKAAQNLRDEIANLEHDELEYAAADKALEKQDHALAEAVATQWRKTEITKDGGSEAQTRKRYAEQGQNFDDAVRDQFRAILVRIFYERKIRPLIQINAQDMRRYYQENIRSYTVPAAAKFRVIKIGIQQSGGVDNARDKAKMILEKIKSGEDFADLAGRFNDDSLLMAHKGAIGENGWMEKGAYVVEKVEQAVWKLAPGQITPEPIADGDALYLAKLEALEQGRTKLFESAEVQDAIQDKLYREQFYQLRLKYLEKLQIAVIRNEGMAEVTFDIIMQRYPQWSRQK